MSFESKNELVSDFELSTPEAVTAFVDAWGIVEELERWQYESLYFYFIEQAFHTLQEQGSDWDHIGFGSLVSLQDYSAPSNELSGWIIEIKDKLGLKQDLLHQNQEHGKINYLNLSEQRGRFKYSLGYRRRSGSPYKAENTFELGIVREII